MTLEEFKLACKDGVDAWLPACGGQEVPMNTRTGDRVLYCYNPAEERHAYLDLRSDIDIPQSDLWAFGLPAGAP